MKLMHARQTHRDSRYRTTRSIHSSMNGMNEFLVHGAERRREFDPPTFKNPIREITLESWPISDHPLTLITLGIYNWIHRYLMQQKWEPFPLPSRGEGAFQPFSLSTSVAGPTVSHGLDQNWSHHHHRLYTTIYSFNDRLMSRSTFINSF